MSFRDRQRQAREQEIVQTARQLLLTKGYHGTAMDEVALLVGISKATLYQHFASKDELIARLIAQHMDSVLAVLEAPDDGAGPLDRLTAALRLIVGVHAEGAASDLDTNSAEIRALIMNHPACRERRERVLRQLGALVVAGQRAGTIRTDIVPAIAVQALFGLSCVASRSCDPDGQPLDPATVSESIVRLYLHGIQGGH